MTEYEIESLDRIGARNADEALCLKSAVIPSGTGRFYPALQNWRKI